MMRLGIGVGVGRQRFAGGFADSYSSRVLADGGTIESLSCVANASTLLQQASLLFIPSGYKAGVAYSALPNNGNGDLTWTRNSTANRTNSSGVIESVGANVPRLSYMYGSCPSALLEPQRTNLLLHSEEFDNSYWAKANMPVTANQAISPDGQLTADLLTPSTADANVSKTFTPSSTQSHTFSVWLRSATGSDLSVSMRVWRSSPFANVSVKNITATNSWQRFDIVFSPLDTTSHIVVIGGGSSISVGENLYAWGAQLELGAYATTYIPTTSATATRLADAFTRNNIYTNGIISASGGTWFVELKNNVTYTRDAIGGLYIGTDSFSGNIGSSFIFRNNGGSARYTIRKLLSGTATELFTPTSDNIKVAIKWNGTTADVFVNGVKVVSATAFNVTNMEHLNASLIPVPTFIQAMALWNEPKSDQFCIDLTT